MKSSKKQKVYITLGSPVVPLLSTYKADSNLTSECWRDQVFYATYERIQRKEIKVGYMNTSINQCYKHNQSSMNTIKFQLVSCWTSNNYSLYIIYFYSYTLSFSNQLRL